MRENVSLAQAKLEPVRNGKDRETNCKNRNVYKLYLIQLFLHRWNRFDVFQDIEKVFIGSFERWYAYMFIRGMYIILVRS